MTQMVMENYVMLSKNCEEIVKIFVLFRFLRAVLPGDNPILRTEVSQRPISEILEGGRLRDVLEYTLAKLLNE